MANEEKKGKEARELRA